MPGAAVFRARCLFSLPLLSVVACNSGISQRLIPVRLDLALGEAQFYSVPRRVLEKQLGYAKRRYLASPEFDIVPLQARLHFRAIGTGKRHVIKSGGDMRKAHFIRVCLAQVENTLLAGVKPIPKAFKRWTPPLRESHYFAIEILELVYQLARTAQIVMIESNRAHVAPDSYRFTPLFRRSTGFQQFGDFLMIFAQSPVQCRFSHLVPDVGIGAVFQEHLCGIHIIASGRHH